MVPTATPAPEGGALLHHSDCLNYVGPSSKGKLSVAHVFMYLYFIIFSLYLFKGNLSTRSDDIHNSLHTLRDWKEESEFERPIKERGSRHT